MEKSCTVISREIERRTNLKYNRKYAAILSLLFIVNIIGNTACGNTSAETGHVSIADMAMENTPIINYTIPTFTPNVLVDQQGYAGDGEKQAIVKSREPVESFRLIDKESGISGEGKAAGVQRGSAIIHRNSGFFGIYQRGKLLSGMRPGGAVALFFHQGEVL